MAEEETHLVDREEPVATSTYSSLWAMLLGKIFEINPLLCPSCGEMKIIAFVTERQPIRKILGHIGERDHAPAISPARYPPIFCTEIDQTQYGDHHAVKPITDYEFDQTVSG
ncbi:MAG: hypothetical protein ABGY08_02650 [Gammaproteobacteria bacterium]